LSPFLTVNLADCRFSKTNDGNGATQSQFRRDGRALVYGSFTVV
jgi:hypothetical protein